MNSRAARLLWDVFGPVLMASAAWLGSVILKFRSDNLIRRWLEQSWHRNDQARDRFRRATVWPLSWMFDDVPEPGQRLH